MARRGRALRLAPEPCQVRAWWKWTWPLGTGHVRTLSGWPSNSAGIASQLFSVCRNSILGPHLYEPSTMLMQPFSSSTSSRALHAVRGRLILDLVVPDAKLLRACQLRHLLHDDRVGDDLVERLARLPDVHDLS